MRTILLAALAATAFLAGCNDDNSSPGDNDPIVQVPSNNTTGLAPLHFEEGMVFGIDPFNQATGLPCSTPASTCFYYQFTVPANTTVSLTATLAWEVPANDFDLYLYQAGTLVSSDGINSPGAVEVPPSTQVLNHAGLVAGDYEFWVAAWNSAGDSFTLDVVFS